MLVLLLLTMVAPLRFPIWLLSFLYTLRERIFNILSGMRQDRKTSFIRVERQSVRRIQISDLKMKELEELTIIIANAKAAGLAAYLIGLSSKINTYTTAEAIFRDITSMSWVRAVGGPAAIYNGASP